jgi:hypothetical protein
VSRGWGPDPGGCHLGESFQGGEGCAIIGRPNQKRGAAAYATFLTRLTKVPRALLVCPSGTWCGTSVTAHPTCPSCLRPPGTSTPAHCRAQTTTLSTSPALWAACSFWVRGLLGCRPPKVPGGMHYASRLIGLLEWASSHGMKSYAQDAHIRAKHKAMCFSKTFAPRALDPLRQVARRQHRRARTHPKAGRRAAAAAAAADWRRGHRAQPAKRAC